VNKADQAKAEHIDPIGYYENRYFPYGFDDPSKVEHFHPHHYNAQGEAVVEETPVEPDYLK